MNVFFIDIFLRFQKNYCFFLIILWKNQFLFIIINFNLKIMKLEIWPIEFFVFSIKKSIFFVSLYNILFFIKYIFRHFKNYVKNLQNLRNIKRFCSFFTKINIIFHILFFFKKFLWHILFLWFFSNVLYGQLYFHIFWFFLIFFLKINKILKYFL